MYQGDIATPIKDRYIHAVHAVDTKLIVVTMFADLVALIHKAAYVQVDTTFKRVVGDLNEWELTIYSREATRGTPNG